MAGKEKPFGASIILRNGHVIELESLKDLKVKWMRSEQRVTELSYEFTHHAVPAFPLFINVYEVIAVVEHR